MRRNLSHCTVLSGRGDSMKKAHKTKLSPKRSSTKKPAARSAKKPTSRAALSTKQHRKQSVAVERRSAATAPTQLTRVATPLDQSMSLLFWPTFPLAIMQAWWGMGGRRSSDGSSGAAA
jgi:hypothetical protein